MDDGKIRDKCRPTAGKAAVDSRQPAADTCSTAAVTGISPSPPSAGFIVGCGDRPAQSLMTCLVVFLRSLSMHLSFSINILTYKLYCLATHARSVCIQASEAQQL